MVHGALTPSLAASACALSRTERRQSLQRPARLERFGAFGTGPQQVDFGRIPEPGCAAHDLAHRLRSAGRAVDPRVWAALEKVHEVPAGAYIGLGFDGSSSRMTRSISSMPAFSSSLRLKGGLPVRSS